MRYYFTDFFNWEQPRIDALRDEGKFVYPVIDAEGDHYIIKRWGYCNRFAFLITDVDILPKSDDPFMDLITDEEFIALGGKEDECIATPMKDVSAECAALQRKYEKNREEIIKQIQERYS